MCDEFLRENLKVDKILRRQRDEPMKGLPFERSLKKVNEEGPIIKIWVIIHEECSQVLVRVLGAVIQSVLRRLKSQRKLDRRKFAICRQGLYLS